MKLKYGYRFAAGLIAALLFSGCSATKERLDRMDGNPIYEMGKIVVHVELRNAAAKLMRDYLDDHPESTARLPALSVAWEHFWSGSNPFTAAQFDKWVDDQSNELKLTWEERRQLHQAADLLFQYFELDDKGYVTPSPRVKRIVDSFVTGLRQGYREWIAEQA